MVYFCEKGESKEEGGTWGERKEGGRGTLQSTKPEPRRY